MKLLILYGVYEAEKPFAPHAVCKCLNILKEHDIDVFITDDASPSFLGERLKTVIKKQAIAQNVHIWRIEKSTGFRGAMERTIGAFKRIASMDTLYDFVIRLDSDVHFCRNDLDRIFNSKRMEKIGVWGELLKMRYRDFILYIVDAIMPFGFKRKQKDEKYEHKWEFSRFKSVWWSDIGRKALLNGFRGVFVPGSFQIIAGQTILDMSKQGWLTRENSPLGLVFGEDVITNTMALALNHPVRSIRELVPDWSCELFISPNETVDSIKNQGHFFIHPLKDTPWAHALRSAFDFHIDGLDQYFK